MIGGEPRRDPNRTRGAFTLTSLPTIDDKRFVINGDTKNYALSGSTSQTRLYDNTTAGAYYTKSFASNLQVGENKIAMIVHRDTANDTPLDLYLNGILKEANDSGFKFSTNSVHYNAQFSSIITGNYGGTLYYTAGVATEADIRALPEPTALALLALGVAGLALRRKVA